MADEQVNMESLPRRELLEGAIRVTCSDRNKQYGQPYEVMKRHTDQLNALGYRGPGGRLLEPWDNAVIEIALKQARIVGAPHVRDSWLDEAGYAGIGWEAVVLMGTYKNEPHPGNGGYSDDGSGRKRTD
jgi:hypothetical protein